MNNIFMCIVASRKLSFTRDYYPIGAVCGPQSLKFKIARHAIFRSTVSAASVLHMCFYFEFYSGYNSQ